MESELMENSQQVSDTHNAPIVMTRESKKWKTFLIDLCAKLSMYEIQKDRKKYNVADIKDWGVSEKKQGIEITKNTLDLFLNKTAHYNITEYGSVKNIAITESQLLELNHILSLTLKHEVNKSCQLPNEFVIKGDYIKFSDFIKDDGNLNLNEECKNVTAVNVFALNTVFVDRNIILPGKKINLSIVSPKWEIISTRTIELSGVQDHSNPPVSVTNTKIYGSNDGRDGAPGLPGTVGGNFFGIGAEFVNGNNFFIITNGGKGGAGGDGENGEKGNNGYLTLILDNEERCTSETCTGGRKFTSLDGTKWDCEKQSYWSRYYDAPHYVNRIECVEKIFGIRGEEGGHGGDGGKGGHGGNPGDIILFELNKPSGISRYNSTGENGKNGQGGIGGDGGVDGDDVVIAFSSGKDYSQWRVSDVIHNKRSNKQGQNGIDGTNEQGIQNPETAAVPKPAKIISKYKHYLRENLNDRFKKYPLIEFLHQLDNNDNVKSVYDTLELFNELKDLEEQFINFNKDVDLVPLYQLLLNRISEYAQNPKDIEKSSQYKKILIYLYTATSGKISLLRDYSESNLIINIDKHLDLIRKDVEILRNLQVASDKAVLINNYKEDYKRDIDRRIDEAKYVIEQQITPEINDLMRRIDREIVKLISEIREMEQLAIIEKLKLFNAREQLKEAIKLRGLFSGLKIVSGIVSFFGPIGLAAGSLIGSISTAVESSVIDDRIDKQRSLRSDIRSYGNQIEAAKNERINNLNELLEDISRKINAYPEDLGDIAEKISDMKNRLTEVRMDKFAQIEMMENELKHQLKKKVDELTGSMNKVNNDKKSARAIAVMGKINQAVELYAIGFDIYNKFKSDEADVNAITAAIAQETQKIKNLENYEKSIRNITIPMLQNMEDNLRGIASELDTKSQVSLDVTKWQVQSALKSIKLKMEKLTRMFEDVHDDLSHCIEMLADTMTALINIYDRIQDYQREQKFVNFCADINYVTGSDVYITDPRISNIVDQDYVEKLIRSNHVIMKYKRAIEAFKNFVFPLANEYLSNSELPSHLQLENDFENLLLKATTQMEYVKSKIDVYKTYLNGAGYNPYIKLGQFTSLYISTEPFFVWKNVHNKDMIGKLLTGQKVTVRASIIDSPAYKDAIKFSVAEFFFKAINDTLQAEINSVLRGFEIEAVHLGDSHYRCDDKIYRITSNATSISYHLEKRSDGQPVSKSLTYVRLKESDSILSPYATWEVTLRNSKKTITFHDLQKYKDVVDLELMGDGSYIDNRVIDYSELTIEKYYRDIKMYNQIDLPTKSEVTRTSGTSSNHRNVRSVDKQNDSHVSIDSSLGFLSTVNKIGNFFKEKVQSWIGKVEVYGGMSGDSGVVYDDHDLSQFNRNTVAGDVPDSKAHQLKAHPLTNGFIDSENHSTSVVNYDSLDKHGNLLLLDLLFRKRNKSEANYKYEDNAITDHLDTEYAQNLAYSAYVRKHKSSNNLTYI